MAAGHDRKGQGRRTSPIRRARNRIRRAVGLAPLGASRGDAAARPGLPVFRRERPVSGAELAGGVTLYHDAEGGEYAVTGLEGGGLRFTIYQFAGSYLSLVKPVEDAGGLGHPGLRALRVRLDCDATRPIATFLRLNLNGPERHESLHEGFVIDQGTREAEFDLSGLDMAGLGLRSAWVDIIFSRPAMSEIRVDAIGLELVR